MEVFLNTIGIYLAVINIAAAVVTVIDKIAAILGRRRIRESTLLLISAVGGSPAMLAVMLIIRHKTRKPKFMIGIPVILAIQLAAAFFLWRILYGG